MPRAILYPEWDNEQGNSPYPFADGATRKNDLDVILDSAIVDARLYVIGGGVRQYLSLITVTAETVTFSISDSTGIIASGEYSATVGGDTVELTDTYGRPAGVLVGVDGSLQFFTTFSIGAHEFEVEATEFISTVVVPTPQIGVRGFVLEGGEFFTKDAWIFGEQGVFFTTEEDGVIRVDIMGDPAAERKFCDALGDFEPTRFIRTINGLVPNGFGDFKLLSGSYEALDTVLRIEPVEAGVTLKFVGGVLQDATN